MRYAKTLSSGAIHFVMDTDSEPPESAGFIVVAPDVTAQTHWIKDGVATEYATKNYLNMPSYPCTWSPESEQWVDARDLKELIAVKLREVEDERDRRISSPIEYLGHLVDADARAQANITNKINEINARIQLGQLMPESLMMWLDANNQVVTFDSQEQMRDWLQGLVIAITQRGTEAYAWSWQVKDQLRSLESKDAIVQLMLPPALRG